MLAEVFVEIVTVHDPFHELVEQRVVLGRHIGLDDPPELVHIRDRHPKLATPIHITESPDIHRLDLRSQLNLDNLANGFHRHTTVVIRNNGHHGLERNHEVAVDHLDLQSAQPRANIPHLHSSHKVGLIEDLANLFLLLDLAIELLKLIRQVRARNHILQKTRETLLLK